MHQCDPRDLDKQTDRKFKNEDFLVNFLNLNQEIINVVKTLFPIQRLETFEFNEVLQNHSIYLHNKYTKLKHETTDCEEGLIINNNVYVDVWTTTLKDADFLQMIICAFSILDLSNIDIKSEIHKGIQNFNSYNDIYRFTEKELKKIN
jgi:hypothetical protein